MPLRHFCDNELDRLVEQARIHNFSEDITGVLLCNGQHFLQLLEGPAAAVATMYSRIALDPRHSHVITLLEGSTPERLFPRQNLAFSRVDAAALDQLVHLLQCQSQAAQADRTRYENAVADLLHELLAVPAGPYPAGAWR